MATICVSGTIGAGKTTLMKFLSEETGFPVFYEGIEKNPILPLMYKTPERWAFTLQIGFLQRKFEIMQEAASMDFAFVERTIFEDRLFVANHKDLGNISQQEWDVYKKVYQSFTSSKESIPSLTIFLDISDDLMLQRIKERNRSCEQEVDIIYYKNLNKLYRNFMATYPYTKKIINCSQVDFSTLKQRNYMTVFYEKAKEGRKNKMSMYDLATSGYHRWHFKKDIVYWGWCCSQSCGEPSDILKLSEEMFTQYKDEFFRDSWDGQFDNFDNIEKAKTLFDEAFKEGWEIGYLRGKRSAQNH